jgi:hypothetical protein
MDRELLSWIFTVSPPMISVIVGGYYYTKLSRSLKFLYYFVVLGGLTEVANLIFTKVLGISKNMPIGNAYFFFSFIFLALYFLYLFKNYLRSRYIVVIIVLYELCFVVNFVFFQQIIEYPAILKGISDILFLGFTILYFHKTMFEAKVVSIWDESHVYTNLAVLTYFAGSLFYSIFFNLVLEFAPEFATFSQNYFYVLNGVFYFLITIGFWKAGKHKTVKA